MLDFFFNSKEVTTLTNVDTTYLVTELTNPVLYFNKTFLMSYLNNLLLVYFIYMFFKLVLLSSMMELMWPTHYFNKKHNISLNKIKYRSFLEIFLKSMPNSPYFVTLNVALFRFFKF